MSAPAARRLRSASCAPTACTSRAASSRGGFELDLAFEVASGRGAGRARAQRRRQDHPAAGRRRPEQLSQGSVGVGRARLAADRASSSRPSSAGPASSSRTTGCSRTSTCATTSPSRRGRAAAVGQRRGRTRQEWLDRLGLGRARRPAARTSSPAARPSGSRWPGRSPSSRRCCCSTSRWPRSTRAPGSTYAPSCGAHLADFAGPVVLVTHDPLEAMVLADRLIVLEAGRVVQQGTPGGGRPPPGLGVRRPAGRPQPLVRHPRRRGTRRPR